MDYREEYEAQRRLVRALGDYVVNSESTLPNCKFCGSDDVVRNGHRAGTQYWLCKRCGHGFVANKAIIGGRYPVDVVSRALYNYYAGMSLNAICEGIRQETGSTVSDTTIYNWLAKYTTIALNEADKCRPQVGKKWVMDETVVTLDGKKYWLITALDKDTRYLVGTKLSTNRSSKDIQDVLEKATAKTGVTPSVVFTDGWGGYREGMEQAYGADSKHVVTQPFTDADMSTNLMERWNGTLKDRLKPMRGMDRNTNLQLILEGFIFYYNYLRPHMGIGGKTPAEKANTGYPYQNWGDIVKSQMLKMVLTKEDKTRYRVNRKMREARRKPSQVREDRANTSIRRIQ